MLASRGLNSPHRPPARNWEAKKPRPCGLFADDFCRYAFMSAQDGSRPGFCSGATRRSPEAATGTTAVHAFTTICWRWLARVGRTLPASFGRGFRPFERGGGRSSEPAWTAAVGQTIAELENLNQVTERDFLAVGGKLMEFVSAARRISSEMTALTDLMSDEQAGHAAQALTRMRERSGEMGLRIERGGQALAGVRGLSRRIQSAFVKLQQMVAVIRTLCTLTRIETARLGADGSDFGDLADEVNPLSASIQSSGQGVLDASARLDFEVQAALAQGSDLSAAAMRELHALMDGVGESLRSFEERRLRAGQASARHAAQHAAVCEAIEDLVQSVQFHDITRQQIEHVCQALAEILAGTPPGLVEERSAPQRAQAVLTLQNLQLSGAAAAFARSMEGMERDLGSIAARSSQMAEESRALTGLSGEERNSFFLRMEDSFTSILHAASACAAAESALGRMASELERTIRSMRESIQEIRGVEIHIQRIAINATIRSAHIGAAGNGLNVIADVLRRVAVDSNRNTEDVAAALDAMSAAVQAVTAGPSGAVSRGDPEAEEGAGQMRAAILELRASSESSFRRVTEIATLGSRLGEEIGSLRSGLTAGPLFAAVVARARAELRRIGAEERPAAFSSLELDSSESLASHAQRYTMQAERDVHEAVVQGAATPAAGAPSAEPAAERQDGGLGDNIEFF